MIFLRASWLTVLLGVVVIVHATETDRSFMDALNGVEKIRKTKPDLFKQQLDELSPMQSQFSVEERCYYDFLRFYAEGYEGNYESTIKNVNALNERCPSPANQLRIKKFLANIQMITGDFKDAIQNLNDAIELTESVDDAYLVSQVLNVASISYRLMHQDSLSIKYADLLINANYSREDVCLGQFNKYRVLMRQGQARQHENEIEQATANCQNSQNIIAALFLQLDWYRYTIDKSSTADTEIAAALDHLLSLESQVADTGFKNIHVYYQALLSRLYFMAGQSDMANVSAKKAIEENNVIGETEQLLMAMEVLVSIHLERGQYQQAYRYLKEKSVVENEIYQRKLATQVAYYRVLHENLAQELEIEQLNQNNELLRLENQLAAETAKRQQLMMLLIASLLLLLGVWAFKIKKRHDYFKEVAEIDHLTQVFTRKAFEEKVRVMLEEAAETNSPVNLAIMDLDHFKNVNDQYGHLVGDWVLKQVVLTCEEVADEDILVARLGGEEFCLVSPSISQLQMMRLMEKMRAAIEAMDSSDSGAIFDITASFGVTTTALSGYRVSMLLTHADLALFEAKNKGRNEVVAYDEIMQDVMAVKA
ncbi:tetratricopeptide repeat-containing diguanylate cyclase [Marinicella meishanensis]|uniref:tetratricopeptide repeat-containing diguanylate cyclase n=1 Tax=Marinicella meishanensis TaxID=2873263 RepID=UPI001CBF0640|nr:GGDEF domain-containing protein [Marinicella sp. NBU2979]